MNTIPYLLRRDVLLNENFKFLIKQTWLILEVEDTFWNGFNISTLPLLFFQLYKKNEYDLSLGL